MGKYEPMAEMLREETVDDLTLSFAEIERVLRFPLPPSAHRHRAWWANSYRGGHSQAEGWVGAGWKVRDIDLRAKRIRLERTKRGGRQDRTADDAELWNDARRLTGIDDRVELERAAVTALIQREAGRRLAGLGGTMPNAEPGRRARPFA